MQFVFLKNCNLVQFTNNRIQKCDILVCNGLIARIIFHKSISRQIINHFTRNFIHFKVHELKGCYVIPGFTDSHTHLLSRGIELQRIDLSDCRSPDECLEKLSVERKENIIFGIGWDESHWIKGKKEDLNRRILDKISKSKPVIMRRICGHFAVCNTKALDFIPKKWKIVDRERGYLYEDAALYLSKIFKPDFEMYERGLRMAMSEAHSLGITSIHEITDFNGFKIYQSLKGQLRLRVALYLTDELSEIVNSGLQSNFGDEFLKFAGKKIFMDGSIGAQTAALRIPYQHSKNLGKLLLTEEELSELIKLAEKNSVQLMIHSIGDRSTETILNAFKSARVDRNQLRHRLEHLEILNDKLIAEIARLDLIASMQPNFLRWQYPGGLYERHLGPRYRDMNCFKRIKKAGIKLIFGSDCMPLGPFYGINLAVNHPFIKNRLTPAEALQMYIQKPPIATFDENKKGTIAEGKFADFLVLDKNPLIKENLNSIKILKTFVGGSLVYHYR
ncbi:MAG: amidohydrolase family protein [candidate division WOR-3 bacterium]|nr:amidohydrolase family protein [candidate division WOR-3 bacterium]